MPRICAAEVSAINAAERSAWSGSALSVLALALAGGCFALRPSRGGGETEAPGTETAERLLDTRDVKVPEGYRVEIVAAGLTFPTGITFDDDGTPFVVESGYAYGEAFDAPRLLRIGATAIDVVATGDRHGWMGVDHEGGAFFVAEAGITKPGRILRFDVDGTMTVLVDGLPALGDHHVNGPAVKDGWVYFGVGAATNSGIVGTDNADFGWLARAPRFHDIPCSDVTLRGFNAQSDDPLTEMKGDVAMTGAYLPFGVKSEWGQVIRGQVPCTGAVMRVPVAGGSPESTKIEVVAWGFRNPFGLAFASDGRLFVTDNGYDERGSRPVFGAADWLWEVKSGAWYGWPDYADGRRVSDPRYAHEGKSAPARLLGDMPEPPVPTALFAVHSSSNGIAFSSSARFGHPGQAFVAQFGDQAPVVGKVWAPVGFKVVRVDVQSGVVHDFFVNDANANGPASARGSNGLERPIAVAFDPSGTSLYVVDFGVMAMDEDGAHPRPRTGAVWRIVRADPELAARSAAK